MMLVPLILAAAAALAGDQGGAGAQVATAQVGVEILRPIMVRQSSGLQPLDAEAPAPQVSRRGGAILIEFQ
jgi:hypothetical protein